MTTKKEIQMLGVILKVSPKPSLRPLCSSTKMFFLTLMSDMVRLATHLVCWRALLPSKASVFMAQV